MSHPSLAARRGVIGLGGLRLERAIRSGKAVRARFQPPQREYTARNRLHHVQQQRQQQQQQQQGCAAGGGSGDAPAASAAVAASASQRHHAPFSPTSVLPLVSSAVEGASELASFEAVAGRSAMVGFLVALLLEWTTGGRSTFSLLSPDQAAAMAAAALAAVAAASALAAAAAGRGAGGGTGMGELLRGAGLGRRQGAAAPSAAATEGAAAGDPAPGAAAPAPRRWWWLGAAIHESVLSSLTASRGAASGVSQVKVDEAVDFVVERCLTRSVHPVFDPLYEAVDAGSTVATVLDSFVFGDERADLPQ